jgi:rubrerythrin
MLRDFKEENGYTRADEDREEFWNEFDKFIAERGREYLDRAVNESLKEDLTLVPEEPSDETPVTPEANGVAKLILDAINGETDTIKEYNDLIANTDNEDIIKIIQDITAEENNHIGMLQKALEIVSPNASNIDDGMEEAESMIEEPVANAEPDFVPIGESLNEELSSEDKHTLFEYNQQIQDKIGDMLYVFDHKEHPKAYKDIVKASFLISEAVDDCLGDKDIDESLKESDEDRIKYLKGRLGEIVKAIENGADPERLAVEKNRIMDELHKLGCDDGWFDESLNEKNLKENVSSDEACNELIDEAYRYLEMAADMFEDGAETYHIDGSLGPAQFIDDVGEITYNLDRISSEVFNAVHGIDESLTEDIHDKFKRDIKTAYKKWASDVERVEAKRKEAMDMIPDNASKEQISQYTDFVNNKIYPMVSDFDYEFPHNLEKGDFPFYVTYYSEYPIYEPAEGGYYYAGRDAVWSQGFNSEEEARQFLNDFIVEDGEDWEQDQDGRYTVHGKYIGQDQTIKLEPNQDYLSAIAGWHPYE